jgi:DNA topoisomerase I
MEENLVIVESPAKAKTIEKFLGKDYLVKSSFGHIRDLAKKNLGIDLNNKYTPDYIVSPDKKKVVDELKKLAKGAKTVWLASDEDREGEAISWHLFEVLGLKPENTRRIVFHEITKDAILTAIKNPRFIDINLVNAQQARRVLDRLVGFELSPLLWKKIKPSLSAGRVQSVAVKLIVEREREINNFSVSSSFRIAGQFSFSDPNGKVSEFQAEMEKRITEVDTAKKLLEKIAGADFRVIEVTKKPGKKSPSPPFTTSTLQQEASRKLGFSVSQTMVIAQKLYEAGKITYMRTDSVNLSKTAIAGSARVVENLFGPDYVKTRNFTTKSKGAQEAHEAIRPTYMENSSVDGPSSEKRLYDLIWKRTLASQMSDAVLEKTNIRISNSNTPEIFVASGEVLKFDGFLKVYMESSDDDSVDEDAKGLLPLIKSGDALDLKKMEAAEKFTLQPPRYTEASLVKKLEELGIGRPSTYAPTISTIQQREYVVKEDRPGNTRISRILLLTGKTIKETKKEESFGYEKAKLFPTDIGMIVNDFLEQYFSEIMDYNFTATVEEEFDLIAEGKLVWNSMIDKFYKPFHSKVEHTGKTGERSKGERTLGTDPVSGKPVIVKIGRYGPVVQIGIATDDDKPKFASLLKGQSLETITLDESLELFKLPRTIGVYEESDIVIGVGKFGPYVRHKSKFYSLKKGVDDPMTVTLERAIGIIQGKREEEKNKVIKTFEEEPGILVLNGRYGPYISFEKNNYKIPKSKDPAGLSLEDCRGIIKADSNKSSRKKK